MQELLERFRELSGIVESRPAYNIHLDEEKELREAIEFRINGLTESEIYADIQDVIAERKSLIPQLAFLESIECGKHYLRKQMSVGQDLKTHVALAKCASHAAKSPLLVRKLASLRSPKTPDPVWHAAHAGLQHGDDISKDRRSDSAKAEHSRRAHAMAAFHHFHAAQEYKKLGNARREMTHRIAAEAHHSRAATREGQIGGSYMFHHKTGKHIDWTPVYDKKHEKAEKNKVSRKARDAAKKVWKAHDREEPKAA